MKVRPPTCEWLERQRRADRQRAREEGFAKGTPVVPEPSAKKEGR